MVQRYLPEVRKGDKRIILVDGEIAGAINRVPAPDGDALEPCMSAALAEPATLTRRDKEMGARLGPGAEAARAHLCSGSPRDRR